MDPRRPEAVGARGAQTVGVRALAAALVVLGGVATAAGTFLSLVWIFAPAVSAAAAAAVVATPFVASVVGAGRWSARRGTRVAQAAAVVVTLAFYGWIGVVLISDGLDQMASQTTLGTPAREAVGSFALAACAALLVAVVVAALPARALRLPVAALVGAAGLASGGAGVAAAVGEGGCERFEFDAERWRAALEVEDAPREETDAERIADAIVRCGTFDGATRAEVARGLGERPRPERRTWRYSVGWTNDGIGPGDAQELYVRFGPDGRARRVFLLYD